MQTLPYTILAAVVLLCLQAVASKPHTHHHGTRSPLCNFNGHEEGGDCVCHSGTSGERCEQLNTTVCGPDGKCPSNQYCLYKNIDCLYREDCKDKRGWCLPLDNV
ncbi:hypothetical protein PRIPAC_83406 [Pristionchus pacificus]|uniref:Uncharacterized protein n=1 Tax=Pristionchus pacificus TaxID=54126 RepID=A0A2A6BSV2_PRIPA|nr:hypothetical protein PRIPAC_83406 [Pristionchus pacificus]|eukprot:PDM68968.1 hypothetical protein PRIPAC_47270 [Pristionchus pacificus]